jgi:hypothetical protein
LTVTDDAGCSTALEFTGQTVSCNGGPQAQTTRALTIAAAPSVQISSPANGARYTRGQIVRASYVCRERTDGPGIASCIGTVADGQPINTTNPGTHRFSVTATSKDGQTHTSTVSYTVRLPNNQFTVSHIRTHRDGAISFRVKVPGQGRIDVLETAWKDNLAQAAVLLQPAPRRFVFPRAHRRAHRAGTLKLRVIPNTARQTARAPSHLPRDAEAVGELHPDRRQVPQARLLRPAPPQITRRFSPPSHEKHRAGSELFDDVPRAQAARPQPLPETPACTNDEV